MPIKIPNNLPACEILVSERIFIMPENRAASQDIRELKIVILNLMPIKQVTETQLLRLLGNTPLQVEVTLIHPRTHNSKNTSKEHLGSFYKIFADIKDKMFDGMIITGAPIEHLDFEEVTYWQELKEIMQWSKTNVTSTLHICWGAQAGLYYHYGINKHLLDKKMFGVFKHNRVEENYELIRGFDDVFYVPHSRNTGLIEEDITKKSNLVIMSKSEEAGIYLVASKDKKHVFATGHSEYDRNTLKDEYDRDINKAIKIGVPNNYFPQDDPNNEPIDIWRGHSNLLFSNWLNYYVYQVTPYNFKQTE